MKINLPNRLTLIRILMIPVFVAFALVPHFWAQIVGAVVFVAACITDALDGKIARRDGLVTNFGKFADPIADKILVMSAMIVLVAQNRMPAWVCILILAREFAVSGFRLVAAGKGEVIAAGWLGKIKTTLQMIAVPCLLVLVPIDGFAMWGLFGIVLANVAMYLCLIMTVWSGADYILKNIHYIKDL